MAYSGFKNIAFKVSLVSKEGWQHYKGKTICYENGRRLWEKRSPIFRLCKADALRDAQKMSSDFIIQNFKGE